MKVSLLYTFLDQEIHDEDTTVPVSLHRLPDWRCIGLEEFEPFLVQKKGQVCYRVALMLEPSTKQKVPCVYQLRKPKPLGSNKTGVEIPAFVVPEQFDQMDPTEHEVPLGDLGDPADADPASLHAHLNQTRLILGLA